MKKATVKVIYDAPHYVVVVVDNTTKVVLQHYPELFGDKVQAQKIAKMLAKRY